MSFESTPLKDLAVGDIIYVDVAINRADMADPNSKSTTAKKFVTPSVHSYLSQADQLSPKDKKR